MFNHKDIETYRFEDVPLHRDIYLMEEKWMAVYERDLLKGLAGGKRKYPGYISYASVRRVTASSLEMSWYPNINDRFHEMRIFLARSNFVMCVGSEGYDEKPRIFVKNDWLTDLYLRTNSVFILVDAVGLKDSLAAGNISSSQLDNLRDKIDDLGARHQNIAFVSFADSLLLKTNWSVGMWNSTVKYTYAPERVIRVLPEIAAIYRAVLGLEIYAVISQGRNEFYRDELMHVSLAGNHISLNSLGLPFAQLQAIEHAARAAIKRGEHGYAELYMDDQFFKSLKLNFDFKKRDRQSYLYTSPMTGDFCKYVLSSFQVVIENLEE